MARFSRRTSIGRGLARWSLVAFLAAGTAITSAAYARDDILISIDPTNSFVYMELDGHAADMGLVRGTVSLATDTPFCIASPDHPCSYTVNLIRLDMVSFIVSTENGDYLVADPYSVIQGPIDVVDSGLGIVIPAGATSQGGGNVSGPDIDSGFRSNTQGLPVPLALKLDVSQQMFQLEGEFVTNIEGHQGIATVSASSMSPFVNLPPVANAGPDISVACPQNITLDASRSTDPNDSLALFDWSVNGVSVGSISASSGSSVSVPFTTGTYDVTLAAFDTFGGRGVDHLNVTVTDPKPEFSFVPGDVVTTSCGALNIGRAQAPDPCGKGAATITNNAPASFPVGVTLVTWTATSSSGQKSTALQRVQVDL
ncbi:MAG TPA: PKD domain-containing protein, partial [Polyangiaceae bacterium]